MTSPMLNALPAPPTPPRPSRLKGILIGLALVAIPAAATFLAIHLKRLSDARDREMEKKSLYDPSPLKRVDPALIRYRELMKIPTGMQNPTCLALNGQGRLWVGGDKVLRSFDAGGAKLAEFPVPTTPTCLAIGPDGTLFVGLKDHVELYTAEGKLVSVWPALPPDAASTPPRQPWLTGIAVSEQDVWLADANRKLILRCSRDGRVELQLGDADKARGIQGLVVPSEHLDVAIAGKDTVWIANPGRHQLELYSRTGEIQRAWGKVGSRIDEFYGCCNPADFAVLPDGRIVTSEKGLPRVKIFGDDGHLQCVVAPPAAFTEGQKGLDVAADASGRILVLEPAARAVRVFVPNDGSPK